MSHLLLDPRRVRTKKNLGARPVHSADSLCIYAVFLWWGVPQAFACAIEGHICRWELAPEGTHAIFLGRMWMKTGRACASHDLERKQECSGSKEAHRGEEWLLAEFWTGIPCHSFYPLAKLSANKDLIDLANLCPDLVFFLRRVVPYIPDTWLRAHHRDETMC